MKTILISLILSISAFADGQLCYQPDASQPDQQICIPVSADVQTAISNYVASPANQTSTTDEKGQSVQMPKYLGVGDAIFQNINLFFQGAVADFPPDSVQQVIDAETAKVTAIKTAVLQAAPVPASQADPGVLVKPVPLPIKKQVQ